MDFHAFSCLTGGGGNKDRVLLEKVSAITLEHGKMTNARRTSAIPQVRMYMYSSIVGPSHAGDVLVYVVYQTYSAKVPLFAEVAWLHVASFPGSRAWAWERG